MDPFLNIRIILSPCFFFGSLFVAKLFDDSQFYLTISALQPETVVAIAGIVSGALLPLGFVIGGLTKLILRVCWSKSRDYFEVPLSDATWNRIYSRLRLVPQTKPENKKCRLQAAATFVRLKIDKSLFELINRCDLVSKAYASCAIALVLSAIIASLFLEILFKWQWYLISGLALLTCIGMAIMARNDACGLVEFLSLEFNDRQVPGN